MHKFSFVSCAICFIAFSTQVHSRPCTVDSDDIAKMYDNNIAVGLAGFERANKYFQLLSQMTVEKNVDRLGLIVSDYYSKNVNNGPIADGLVKFNSLSVKLHEQCFGKSR